MNLDLHIRKNEMEKRINSNVKFTLAIWLIAMFVCSSVFTDNATADAVEAVEQIFLGYIAGVLGCAMGGVSGMSAAVYAQPSRIDYGFAIGGGVAMVFVSSAAIYTVGESDRFSREDGSFGWTFVGALALPLVGAGISGMSKSWDPYAIGLLLTPISATIAYQLTKKGDEPSNVNIAAPIIRVRF